METWSLPKARPISCNDCPAFQQLHMSVRWFAESFTRLTCVMNTTFREKIYSRWCCIDRLSRQDLSGSGKRVRRWEHITGPSRLCVKVPICVSQRTLLNLRQDAITFMLPIANVWRLRCVPLLTGGVYAKLQIGCGSFYSNGRLHAHLLHRDSPSHSAGNRSQGSGHPYREQ